jgi:membrane protein YdbS with pleckstrin-like domain
MIGDRAVQRASQWCYRGVWSFFTRWLLVPDEPPKLMGADDESIRSLRPAEGFLRYLKFYFWIGLVAIDLALTIGWIAIFFASPLVGILITPLALAIIVLPDVVAYIAIHLRYDSTWYVLSDRTMRIRRGIWIIHETTITYENIQNVSVQQGPVQRYFGIANLIVETAGGGSSSSGEHVGPSGHVGLIEGIDQPEAIRAMILERWKGAKSAGLGDDTSFGVPIRVSADGWRPEHLDVLQQIRQLAVELARPTSN